MNDTSDVQYFPHLEWQTIACWSYRFSGAVGSDLSDIGTRSYLPFIAVSLKIQRRMSPS